MRCYIKIHKIDSGSQKLIGGGGGFTETNTQTAWLSHEHTFIFQNKKIKKKVKKIIGRCGLDSSSSG
jgi:hypothetical protein